MFGKITKYFHDRGYGFIRGEDGNTYFVHVSNLDGEYLDKGYYVWFKPFANDRSDYNASNVNVVNANDSKAKEQQIKCKKKDNRKRKSCNADKVMKNSKSFHKFVREFMREQKKKIGE